MARRIWLSEAQKRQEDAFEDIELPDAAEEMASPSGGSVRFHKCCCCRDRDLHVKAHNQRVHRSAHRNEPSGGCTFVAALAHVERNGSSSTCWERRSPDLFIQQDNGDGGKQHFERGELTDLFDHMEDLPIQAVLRHSHSRRDNEPLHERRGHVQRGVEQRGRLGPCMLVVCHRC